MAQSISEQVGMGLERAELRAVLRSPIFVRSPTLSRLLTYLCEKVFAGEADSIKEYSIAVDVFARRESFDQDADSIVRVEVNRLRKRLAEYYVAEGAGDRLRIVIPVGQYVPAFEPVAQQPTAGEVRAPAGAGVSPPIAASRPAPAWLLWAIVILLTAGALTAFVLRQRTAQPKVPVTASRAAAVAQPEPPAPITAGDEIRILVGSSRSYVDHSGKLWTPDSYFSGGSSMHSPVQRVWRTQDPTIYRTSRQGNFDYDIPLKRRTYELRLHFAETSYGPEEAGGGGEGSRLMTVRANGSTLLSDFDVVADAGASRTADVKVFTGITPAEDGRLHLSLASSAGAPAMLSGIELVPGVTGHMRPIRIVARDLPYYSNDSQWWSADAYFKGGQLGGGLEPAAGTHDPELYETERWGHFSYAIPATPGKYTVVLHFIEHRQDLPEKSAAGPSGSARAEERVFDVFCNGQRIIGQLNLFNEAGANHPVVRSIGNLEPNAQGKLLLEFVPVSYYATVSAIEVLPQ